MTDDVDIPKPIQRSAYVEITSDVLCQRLIWLKRFVDRNGFFPTYEMIANGWQVTKSAVRHSLSLMAERGWVRFVGKRSILTNEDTCYEPKPERVVTGEGWRKLS